MRCHRLLSAVAVVATAVVLGASATAAARNISSSSGNFRQTYGSITFESEEVESITCPLTLEGSLASRTFSKVTGSQIGSITRANIGEGACTGPATAGIESGRLPWRLAYQSFEGALPSFTRMNRAAIGSGIWLRFGLLVCWYYNIEFNTGFTIILTRNAQGRVTAVFFSGWVVGSETNSPMCPTLWIAWPPPGRETVPGTTTEITLTLI